GLVGGGYDDSEGYFVEPTVLETTDPNFRTMREELFGPVVTTYVYPEGKYGETLELIDRGAPYGLTGAVFAREREALDLADEKLRYAAGNFYVNDKPTGAVVGQQPFGGSRASGTNDKAGSMWNLIRWVSPRTIKETFDPPTDYRYPFMAPDDRRLRRRNLSECGHPGSRRRRRPALPREAPDRRLDLHDARLDISAADPVRPGGGGLLRPLGDQPARSSRTQCPEEPKAAG